MTEPTSTAAGAVTGGLGALPILVLGAQVDALVLGLFASMLATAQLEDIDSFRRALSAAFFSSIAAGYFSPLVAGWLAAFLASLPGAWVGGSEALRMPMAFAIGALMPTLWPILLRRAQRNAEKGGV